MNKKELIRSIAERTKLTQKDTGKMVEILFNNVTQALQEGEGVNIAGFGCFDTKTRAPRISKNPRTGKSYFVPETTVPVFKPNRRLKEAVAKK